MHCYTPCWNMFISSDLTVLSIYFSVLSICIFTMLSICLLLALLFLVPLTLRYVRRHPSRDHPLSGKHVWIIGASRGLGRQLAETLSQHNCKLSISARNKSQLQTLAQLIPSQNLICIAPLDVTDLPSVTSTFHVVQTACPIDIIIANAGINQGATPFEKLSSVQITNLIDTNIRYVLHLFHVAVPFLVGRAGILCAISSVAAYRGLPGATVYGACKAAVTNFCQALSIELYDSDADVICVHPAFIDTDAIRFLSHPKPFLMSAQRAADHVVSALVCRSSHVAFPWIMEHVILKLSTALPAGVYNFIMFHTGAQKRAD